MQHREGIWSHSRGQAGIAGYFADAANEYRSKIGLKS